MELVDDEVSGKVMNVRSNGRNNLVISIMRAGTGEHETREFPVRSFDNPRDYEEAVLRDVEVLPYQAALQGQRVRHSKIKKGDELKTVDYTLEILSGNLEGEKYEARTIGGF